MRECFTPQPINNLLKKSSLKSITDHYHSLSKIDNYLKSYFPAELTDYISIANYQNNVLTLHIANAAILMRIKYEHIALQSSIRKDLLPGLSSIVYKVKPN